METRVSTPSPTRVRAPDGSINNCSIAEGGEEKTCQVCSGKCPEPRGHRPIAESVAAGDAFPWGVGELRSPARPTGAPVGVDWVSTPAQIEEDERAERAVAFARSSSDLLPGDRVTYSWGPETHCPVQWHSVTVGPFSATVTVAEGEAGYDAVARAKRVVARMVDDELERRIREHEARAVKNRPSGKR